MLGPYFLSRLQCPMCVQKNFEVTASVHPKIRLLSTVGKERIFWSGAGSGDSPSANGSTDREKWARHGIYYRTGFPSFKNSFSVCILPLAAAVPLATYLTLPSQQPTRLLVEVSWKSVRTLRQLLETCRCSLRSVHVSRKQKVLSI